MLVDPSGQYTVPDAVASSVIISVLSTVARLNYEAVYKQKFFTVGDVLAEVGIAAVSGALGGQSTIFLSNKALGFQAARYLKPVLKRMVEVGVATGTSNVVEQVTSDLLRFAFLHEPIEFMARPGRFLTVSFSSFVLGGVLVRVTPAFRAYEVRGFGPSYREVLVSYEELAGSLGAAVENLRDVFIEIALHESLHDSIADWLR